MMASPAGRQNALPIVPQPGQAASGQLPGPPSPTTALIDRLSFLTAKKLESSSQPAKKQQQQQQDVSSDDDEDYPPDSQQCTVSGPGFAGGASGAPTNMFIHVKDSRGRRLKSGGEDVSVRVHFSGTSEYLPVVVTDNDDGTYTAVYTPPAKGNYQVTIEVNGIPIAGSPFPVFFSTPLDPATFTAQQTTHDLDISRAVAVSDPTSITSMAAAAGISAVQAITDEHLRTLYVGNISPAVPIEGLKRLFGHVGTVLDMSVVGDRKDMAVVVFSTKEAQQQGQQLNNTPFGDRPLAVTAPMTAMAAGVVPANPQLAMQMQQIQQMQQTLLQSQKLAAQVAQMRAYNKTGVVVREDPQKAAQEAAARIASKLAGTGSSIAAQLAAAGASAAAAAANNNIAELAAATTAMHKDNANKDKRGGSRSPRKRSRSRSRERHHRNYRDSHQHDRNRDHERERRERERRDQELRERERERERQRDWDRRADRERDRGRDRDRDRGRARDSSRDRKDRHHSRSTSKDGHARDRDGIKKQHRSSRRDERRDPPPEVKIKADSAPDAAAGPSPSHTRNGQAHGDDDHGVGHHQTAPASNDHKGQAPEVNIKDGERHEGQKVAADADKRHRHKDRNYRTKRTEDIGDDNDTRVRSRSPKSSRSPRRASRSPKRSHKSRR